MSRPPGPHASPEPVGRVIPTWTEPLAAAASRVVGGPLGAHAVVGRSRFWTPLRVVLLVAVALLALGWLGKAPCLQQYKTDDGLALDWRNNRQYVAMCYSDTVPLYGIERLDSGAVPYRDSWVQDPGTATEQVRYMEYPVLTGFFQYANARLAADWLALVAQHPWLPSGAAGRRLLHRLRVLAGARVAGHRLGGVPAAARAAVGRRARRLLAAGGGARVHQLRRARRRVRDRRAARVRPTPAGARRGAAGCGRRRRSSTRCSCWCRWCSLGVRRRDPGPVVRTTVAALATWAAVNVPVALAWTRGLVGVLPAQHQPHRRPRLALVRRLLLHRLARVRRRARRRERSRRCSTPSIARAVRGGVRRAWSCSCAVPRSPRGSRRWRSSSSRRSCWSTRCGARSTRCGSCRWRCSRCPAGGCCWRG